MSFGLAAFCLHPFQSARSNARQTIPVARTALHKLERLLENVRIAEQLAKELIEQVKITSKTIVNIDHTDINFLSSLVGAVQTHKGRAIPVLVESTYAHDIPSFGSRHSTKRTNRLRKMRAEEREKISWTEHIISSIANFVSRLGFCPRFAFDRGFGSSELISYLVSINAIFYIRLKSGRIVDDGYQQIRISDIKSNDEAIEINGTFLRVVRSDKSRKCKEPWYILTNDLRASREKIIRIYYHRFEIEETFRDLKHIFELKRLCFDKPTHLRMVLLLAMLGISMLFAASQMYEQLQQRNEIPRKPPNPRKKLSFVREYYELYLCFSGGDVWGCL